MHSTIKYLLSGAFLGLAALSALTLVQVAREKNPSIEELSAESLPLGNSPNWYAQVASKAEAANRLDLAIAASRRETELAPKTAGAWHRLVAGLTADRGHPDQETLKALIKAYEYAPYPAPAEMIWRVEYAAEWWNWMPDIVQQLTLTQIRTISQMPDGEGWKIRKRWCKDLPDGALRTEACSLDGHTVTQ